MQLKKINANLQQALIENELLEANEMQQDTFSILEATSILMLGLLLIHHQQNGKHSLG